VKHFNRGFGRLFQNGAMALAALILFQSGGAPQAEAQCRRCSRASAPLPRQTFGSTNFLSAYVNRDEKANQSGCFWADGMGVMRKLVSGQPIKFTVLFIPVVDVTTITNGGGGSITVGADISTTGAGGSIQGGGSFTHAKTTGGFVTLNVDTFSAVTDGTTTRMANVGPSPFCPLLPTAKAWMQGKAELTQYSSRVVFAMTPSI
jgi:hypothetical protein